MIKTNIVNTSTGHEAEVDHIPNEAQALVVATRPLKIFENEIQFFANSDFGIAMNQSAVPSGTPEEVHNGTDDTLWTGTEIAGVKTTFNSGDRWHATGALSVKTDNAAVNDVYQFAKGSDITLSDYTSLTIWINVDNDWATDSISIYGWNTGTASQVGSAVFLEDYFTQIEFDIWHKLSIPLSDMALTGGTMDALRIQQITKVGAKAPKYYLDDMQLEEAVAGAMPIVFSLEPQKGTWLHISSFQVFMADDDYDSDNASGSVPAIPYNSFLGVNSLNTGIIYQRIQNDDVKQSIVLKQLSHLLRLPGTRISDKGSASDGTATWISVATIFDEPLVLKSETHDKLQLTISDDLTGLDVLNISAHSKIEYR